MAINFSQIAGGFAAGTTGLALLGAGTPAAAKTTLGLASLNDVSGVATTTNDFEVSKTSPTVNFRKAAEAGNSTINSYTGTALRWSMSLSGATTSNFALRGYADDGVANTLALSVNRVTGLSSFKDLKVDGQLNGGSGSSILSLNKSADNGYSSTLVGTSNGISRWALEFGNSNQGDFVLSRYSDAGALLNYPFQINRANGNTTFTGSVTVNSSLMTLATGNFVQLALSKSSDGSGSSYLSGQANGSVRWIMELGSQGPSDFILGRYNDSGGYLGSSIGIERSNGTIHLYGPVICAQGLISGRHSSTDGYETRAGTQNGLNGYVFNFGWNGSQMLPYINDVAMTAIPAASDERVKQDIELLTADTDNFLAVKPISFHYRNVGIFANNGIRYYGFSAQNLQTRIAGSTYGDLTAINEEGDPIPGGLNDRAILAATIVELQKAILQIKQLEVKVAALEA